jgi:hypothetical protein
MYLFQHHFFSTHSSRVEPREELYCWKTEQGNPAPKHRYLLCVKLMRHVKQAAQRMQQVNKFVRVQPETPIAR